MKYFGIFILIGLFVIQMVSSSLIVLNYRVNMDYIIENFCENTDKPEMKCNGKCHLSKQIKEDTEQKSETPASVTEITTFVLAVEDIPSFAFSFWNSELNPCNSLYIEGDYSNHLQSIFHPPQV